MNDDLTSLLRTHDPAAGKALNEFERTRILSRSRGARRSPYRRWAVSLTFVALVAFVAALAVIRRDSPAPAQVSTARQIQYATPGGTRIIWTLDPNFHSEALR